MKKPTKIYIGIITDNLEFHSRLLIFRQPSDEITYLGKKYERIPVEGNDKHACYASTDQVKALLNADPIPVNPLFAQHGN